MNTGSELIENLKRRLEIQQKAVEEYDAKIRELQGQRQIAAQHLRYLKEDLHKIIESFDKRNTTKNPCNEI